MRSAFRTEIVVSTLGAAALLWATAARIRNLAPIRFARAATVLSNSHPAQRPVVPILVFLGDVRRVVPTGSRIAVITPARDTATLSRNYLIAVGQLPDDGVIPIFDDSEKLRTVDTADFVASYQNPLNSPRLMRIGVFADGFVYRVAR